MKKHSLWILFMGGIGLSGFSALFYTAPNYTSVINIGIIQCTMPAFILIGTLIIFKIRVLKTQVVGLFFTMLGVVILISNGNLSLLLNLVPNFGDIIMLISCIFYASYSVGLQKRPVTDYLTMMFYFAMAAFITSIPMLSIEIYMDKVIWPNINGWIIILYIAVIPSLLSQVLFMRSIDLIGSNKAGLFTNLVPIFVAILGVIILNETFYLFHIISMITVFFGIYIFILADKTSNN
jgi:drug/metabolite transporter (DMT)-like permease